MPIKVKTKKNLCPVCTHKKVCVMLTKNKQPRIRCVDFDAMPIEKRFKGVHVDGKKVNAFFIAYHAEDELILRSQYMSYMDMAEVVANVISVLQQNKELMNHLKCDCNKNEEGVNYIG